MPDMSCSCISYNLPEPHQATKSRAVRFPWGEHRIVDLDECIADTILHLWNADIVTGGSCCGHGDRNPSVVLMDDNPSEALIESACRTIRKVDDRQWDVHFWTLSKVTT